MVTGLKDVLPLDDIDRLLIDLLTKDGRMPNNALAERAGIAASTCFNRVRNLMAIGAIRGVRADVDPAWLGRPIQAMIAVKLQSSARSTIADFSAAMVDQPAVLNVYFVSGSDDFLVHVAVADTEELRDFIADELSTRQHVAGTETRLIFDHVGR